MDFCWPLGHLGDPSAESWFFLSLISICARRAAATLHWSSSFNKRRDTAIVDVCVNSTSLINHIHKQNLSIFFPLSSTIEPKRLLFECSNAYQHFALHGNTICNQFAHMRSLLLLPIYQRMCAVRHCALELQLAAPQHTCVRLRI